MGLLVKICGLTREQDIETAVSAGADYLGFVLVRKSRRYVSLERLSLLSMCVPPRVKKVGVFVNATCERIEKSIQAGGLDVVQLHGAENGDFIRSLQSLPSLQGVEIWRAVHLSCAEDVEKAKQTSTQIILADAAVGGSGKTCDWNYVAQLSAQREVFLAGGLTAENVVQAIRQTRVKGIDLSTGVEERPGIKSKEKILQLFENIKEFRDE